MKRDILSYDSVEIDSEGLFIRLIDQTKLPAEFSQLTVKEEETLTDAIKELKVRGAPALGITATSGLCVILKNLDIKTISSYICEFDRLADTIVSIRPTAVNIRNGLVRLKCKLNEAVAKYGDDVYQVHNSVFMEAIAIKNEDIISNIKIAEFGITLLKPGSTILTICNAGHFAVSRYGTALAPVYLANERGMDIKVIACETRPLLQGARLTSYELMMSGIDVTLICDSMAGHILSKGLADALITGCDRIAANGDTANKIGTLSLSIAANYYGIPHYVAGPSSTIDSECSSGNLIKVEERDSYEITDKYFKSSIAPEGVKTYNPAFDITPSELISAIITEKGIFRYPYNFNNDND
jgi:methylthioribose-1-phosphate isomerase